MISVDFSEKGMDVFVGLCFLPFILNNSRTHEFDFSFSDSGFFSLYSTLEELMNWIFFFFSLYSGLKSLSL